MMVQWSSGAFYFETLIFSMWSRYFYHSGCRSFKTLFKIKYAKHAPLTQLCDVTEESGNTQYRVEHPFSSLKQLASVTICCGWVLPRQG